MAYVNKMLEMIGALVNILQLIVEIRNGTAKKLLFNVGIKILKKLSFA